MYISSDDQKFNTMCTVSKKGTIFGITSGLERKKKSKFVIQHSKCVWKLDFCKFIKKNGFLSPQKGPKLRGMGPFKGTHLETVHVAHNTQDQENINQEIWYKDLLVHLTFFITETFCKNTFR